MFVLKSTEQIKLNKAAEIPCWSIYIWVVFFAITFGLKETVFFFQSIADSERKLIQSHERNSRPLNTNEIEKLVMLCCIIIRSNSSLG